MRHQTGAALLDETSNSGVGMVELDAMVERLALMVVAKNGERRGETGSLAADAIIIATRKGLTKPVVKGLTL